MWNVVIEPVRIIAWNLEKEKAAIKLNVVIDSDNLEGRYQKVKENSAPEGKIT